MISPEARVGIVLVAGILLVVSIAMFLGGLRLAHQGYPVNVLFNQVLGMTPGAQVRLAGVKIGQVEKVVLTGGNRALVTLRIDKEVKLATSYTFTIGTGLLVGENYVDVQPTEEEGKPVQPDQTLMGVDPVQITDILPDARLALSEFKKLMGSANEMLGDRKAVESVQKALRDLSRITGEAYRVASAALELVQSSRRTVNTFGDVALENKANLKEITGNLAKAASNIEAATDAVKWLTTGGHIKENVRDGMEYVKNAGKNVETATKSIELASKNIEAASKNVEKTTETVKDLVSDKQVQTDVKETIAGTKKAVAKAEVAIDEARKLLETGNAAVKQVSDRISQFGKINIKAEPKISFFSSPARRRYWTDLNVRVSSGDAQKRFWYLGIHDLGDANKLNLQAGTVLNERNQLRYGLYRSKVGAGMDARLGKRGRLSVDAYDPNRLKINMWTEYTLRERWQILLGLEDVKYGGFGVRYSR